MKKHAASKPKKRTTTARAAAPGTRLKIVVSEKDIRKRVREMAKQINRDYAGKTLHIVGNSGGLLRFHGGLGARFDGSGGLLLCSVAGARQRLRSGGHAGDYVHPTRGCGGEGRVAGAGVLQSGITLDHLCRTLLAQQPASLRTAVLIDKSG